VSEGYTTLDAAYAAARWGWYIAAFLVLGAGSYAPFLFRGRTGLHAIEPELSDHLTRRAAAIGMIAALSLVLVTVLRLYLQARTLIDPDEPVDGALVRAILASDWGRGWIRQAVVAGFSALAFTAARSGSRLGWTMGVAAGGGIGIVAGMTGHAATAKAGSYGLLIDTAHVWAGGLWLGGLAVLLLAGVPVCRSLPDERRVATVRALVADFSRRALIFAPLAVGLGVWLAARYLGWDFVLHLLSSRYGGVLLLKLILLVGVGAVGAYNWRVVQPGLAAQAGERRLRGAALLELAFGILLLAATAVLVALPMPGDGM
jgi:putative copper resistance protein D